MLLALIRIVISKGFISTECRFLIDFSGFDFSGSDLRNTGVQKAKARPNDDLEFDDF